MDNPLEALHSEPALAWKLAVGVLGAVPDSAEGRRAAAAVRDAPLVRRLLSECDAHGDVVAAPDGHGKVPGAGRTDGKVIYDPYAKWRGGHWILSLLADLGYPPGDEALRPLMEKTFARWLGQGHAKSIRLIAGRTRRCASQEGNAAWSSLRLGFADGRTQELVARLMKWEWPDGGWNCDKHPGADTSSFMETLIPLRALALYAQATGDPQARLSAGRAAEVFLTRQLYMRRRDGQVMDAHFVRLHYPCYWHYDILFGLKVMAEAGLLADPRCAAALDLLESRRLPDGGFPADESYARTSRPGLSGYSRVDWGGVSRRRMNPFVTADALYVLRAAGRA
jgi:hypothetical protein